MSGAELALAIAGIAIPVFKNSIAGESDVLSYRTTTNCGTAIHFILDVKDADNDRRSLLLSLRLQEKAFYTWGEQAGLVVYEGEDRRSIVKASSALGQSRATVLELLAQIQQIFDEFREFELKNKEIDVNVAAAMPLSDRDIDTFVQSSNQAGEVTEKKRRWLKDSLRGIPEKTKHGWTCVRHASWDKAELKKLIEKFKGLNDSMTSLLDSQLQRQIALTTQETYRVALQMASTVEQIQTFIDAMRVAPNASAQHDPELRRYGELAGFKNFCKELQTGAHDLEINSKSVEVSKAQNGGNRPYRSQGIYKETEKKHTGVWIEWRDYGRFLTPSDGSEPTEEVLKSVRELARLLRREKKPTEFRVPRCLGYFKNTSDRHIGFVFEQPRGAAFKVLPRTLLQLIQDSAAKTFRRPGIMGRFAVAKALASSLMYLHTVDWFHKALRSDNILFFGKDDSDQIDFGDPTISGFDVARPAGNIKDTQTPDSDIEVRMYRHPESLKDETSNPSYCKTFDIYSLGVIFVELALWMPIDVILREFDTEYVKYKYPNIEGDKKRQIDKNEIFDKEHAKGRPAKQKAIRAKLLREDGPAVLAAIELEMGPVYMEVVKCCLIAGREMGAATDVPWTDTQGRPLKEGRASDMVKIGSETETSSEVRATVITKAYIEKVVRRLEEIKI